MNIAKLKSGLLEKKHVVGWSEVLQPKVVNGRETEELAFRVYVSWKPSNLDEEATIPVADRIPKTVTVDGKEIKTDVVNIGKVEALVARDQPVRPVPFGVSIGNWEITSGSNGMSYTRDDKPGQNFLWIKCARPYSRSIPVA